EPAGRLVFPREQARAVVVAREEARERRRRLDRRNARPTRLLGGGDGDPSPALEMAAAPDDVAREERRDAHHAELGRLLDHPVHLVLLEERHRELELETRLARRGRGADDAHDCLARADAAELDLVLGAVVVEEPEAIAGYQAQRAQVTELGAGHAERAVTGGA